MIITNSCLELRSDGYLYKMTVRGRVFEGRSRCSQFAIKEAYGKALKFYCNPLVECGKLVLTGEPVEID